MAISDIVKAFGVDEEHRTDPVDAASVRAWMGSNDPEVQGAVFHYLWNPQYSRRIEPPIPIDEFVAFAQRYFSRCLKEDCFGEWGDSRYEAAWQIVSLFLRLWTDSVFPQERLAELRDWLADLYLEGDDGVREALINGTLEHLFESRNVKKLFKGWLKHPVLREAYAQAAMWPAKHPNLDRSIFGTDV